MARETSYAPRHFTEEYVYEQVKDVDVTLGKESIAI
jgi:hypothetical protein